MGIISILKKSIEKNNIVCMAVILKDKKIINTIDKFMDSKDPDNETLDNIEKIIVASKTVYENDKYVDPFPDDIYDKLLSKFKKFRKEPFANSMFGVANAKYKYDILSGTLDKAHFIYDHDKPSNDDRLSLEEWFNKLPIDNDEEISVFIDQKKDGTSVTIDYKYDGDSSYIPQSAISRGKKDYGEGTDVSAVIPNKKFDAKELYNILGYYPKYIGIQYEFLISNEKKLLFEKYIGQKFANNRSAASGLLRRIIFASSDEAKELRKFMSLVPVGYDVLSKYKNNEFDKISFATLYPIICKAFIYGDISMGHDIIHGTKYEILKNFKDIANDELSKRHKLNHAIDGIVITLLDQYLIKKLGRKNNINKFQVAYKFPEEGIKTTIQDVIITTGNFGYKEILLKVDPVILNGTVQSKAQVHSLKKFHKMKLHIGDEIILKLSGDVIPFGYKDDSCKSGDGKKIKLPEYCEYCGSKLEEEKNKLRCSNKKCACRVIGSLTTFFTELNAKGIGEKTCAQLYNELGISKASDILKMKKDDFKKLSGFKEASASLCMDTINNIVNKPRSLSSIMSSLGIDSFRSATASKVLDVISIEDICELIKNNEKDKLIEIIKKADGVDKNAKIIAEGLIDNIDELKELISLIKVEMKNKEKYDKTILISGIRNDTELENIANKAGFNVKDSGKKFDILVIKDESMLGKSKSKYAKEKNKPIMTRSEFIGKYSN